MNRPESPVPKPPRAEPLQPDRPGSGDGQASKADTEKEAEQRSKASLERQRQQSKDALDNVSEGYD